MQIVTKRELVSDKTVTRDKERQNILIKGQFIKKM